MPLRVLAAFAALALPLFAIACAAVFYLSGHELRIGLLHADALYLPTLFDDLLRRGGRLSDWYLTPAPYYFPDFPLYLLAYWLGPDSYHQIIVFAALQCALLLAAVRALARELEIDAALPCAALSVVLLVWLALSGQEPFVLVLASASHFGAFVSTVFMMLAWLRFERGGSAWALRTACALAFLTTLSDSLFLLQAALPLACAAGARTLLEADYLAGRDQRPKRRRALPWAPLGAAVLGHLGYKVLVMNRTRYSAHMDLRHIGANLHDLGVIALRLWEALPLFVLGWLAFFGFALACTASLALRRGAPFGLPRRLAWLLAFWVISTAGALAVALLVYNIPVAARYFIPAACWPVLLAPLVAAHASGARARAGALALAGALACCVGIGAATVQQWRAHPLQAAYYTDDMACVDRALAPLGLRYGIAQYWDSKTFQRFSHGDIVLAQHDDQLVESRWITSKRYFMPAYDFALVGPQGPSPYNIPPERLEAINGKPQAQVRCGGYTVLLYGRERMRVR